MSGLDPAAAAALSAAVDAADLQFLEAALNLGTSADVLQTQLSTGDIIAARVLPPQNGQDLLSIAGQTVVAQLPPDLRPGETIALQVTGFSGNQILVRNLGVIDPQNPPQLAQLVLEATTATGQLPPQTATLTSTLPSTRTPSSPALPPPSAPSGPSPSPIAPPKEIFVAASVVRPPPAPAPQATNDVPASQPVSPPPPIEIRIVTAQNAARSAPPPAQAPAPVVAHNSGSRITASIPPITIKPSIARTVSDALRAAKLPDTAFTRTVAAIAQQAPQRLASVLRRLDNALAQLPNEPRAATARSIAAFVSRLNLANRETLPAQVEAFVSHVVRGAEAKLVALLQTLAETQTVPHDAAAGTKTPLAQNAAAPLQEEPALGADSRAPAGAASNANASGPTADPARMPASPIETHARAAVLAAARDHDLKTVLLSLARDLPAGRTPTITQALNESLVTLAGTQLHALNANAQSPGTITIALPAFFHEGGKPAYLRISRDGGNSKAAFDADNFHIGFVLDTAHLGTVGIDVQTAGRAVNVEVKTETSSAAAQFTESFGTLRERLETLRYRMSSTSANVLTPPQPQAQASAAEVSKNGNGSSTLDAQA